MTEDELLRPIDPDWPEARQAAYIDIALRSGVPWKVIAAGLRLPDKRAAKRYRRELEHRVMLRQLTG
jgi:hypothetical protein